MYANTITAFSDICQIKVHTEEKLITLKILTTVTDRSEQCILHSTMQQ